MRVPRWLVGIRSYLTYGIISYKRNVIPIFSARQANGHEITECRSRRHESQEIPSSKIKEKFILKSRQAVISRSLKRRICLLLVDSDRFVIRPVHDLKKNRRKMGRTLIGPEIQKNPDFSRKMVYLSQR